MLELEKFAETRVRKSGQNAERVDRKSRHCVFPAREPAGITPTFITHCVVFNATFDPVENRWKAATGRDVSCSSFATNFYRHELCRGLRALI